MNFTKTTTVIISKLKFAVATPIVIISMLLTLPVSSYAADPLAGSTSRITQTNVEHRINMAQRLLDKEEYKEAVRNLQTTVMRHRYSTDAWKLLGFAHLEAGDIYAANAAYTRALSIDRYHLGTLEYQGELFVTLGKIDDAEINLRLINELCPVGCKEQRDLQASIAAAK